jgi:hypothetical protein
MQELHTRLDFSLPDRRISPRKRGKSHVDRQVFVLAETAVAAVLRFAIMRRFRAFVRASIAAFGLVIVLVTPAFAQVTGSPAAKPGLCAPWHRCVAYLTLGVVVLYVLLTAGMYALQRRGFDKVEHRQGNPEGVPTKKE